MCKNRGPKGLALTQQVRRDARLDATRSTVSFPASFKHPAVAGEVVSCAAQPAKPQQARTMPPKAAAKGTSLPGPGAAVSSVSFTRDAVEVTSSTVSSTAISTDKELASSAAGPFVIFRDDSIAKESWMGSDADAAAAEDGAARCWPSWWPAPSKWIRAGDLVPQPESAESNAEAEAVKGGKKDTGGGKGAGKVKKRTSTVAPVLEDRDEDEFGRLLPRIVLPNGAGKRGESKYGGPTGINDDGPSADLFISSRSMLCLFGGLESIRGPEEASDGLWDLIYPRCQTTGKPCFNASGKHIVKLWQGGEWVAVDVNDSIPLDEDGSPLIPCSSDPRELWPCLLAKALIKLRCNSALAKAASPAECSAFYMMALTGWSTALHHLPADCSLRSLSAPFFSESALKLPDINRGDEREMRRRQLEEDFKQKQALFLNRRRRRNLEGTGPPVPSADEILAVNDARRARIKELDSMIRGPRDRVSVICIGSQVYPILALSSSHEGGGGGASVLVLWDVPHAADQPSSEAQAVESGVKEGQNSETADDEPPTSEDSQTVAVKSESPPAVSLCEPTATWLREENLRNSSAGEIVVVSAKVSGRSHHAACLHHHGPEELAPTLLRVAAGDDTSVPVELTIVVDPDVALMEDDQSSAPGPQTQLILRDMTGAIRMRMIHPARGSSLPWSASTQMLDLETEKIDDEDSAEDQLFFLSLTPTFRGTCSFHCSSQVSLGCAADIWQGKGTPAVSERGRFEKLPASSSKEWRVVLRRLLKVKKDPDSEEGGEAASPSSPPPVYAHIIFHLEAGQRTGHVRSHHRLAIVDNCTGQEVRYFPLLEVCNFPVLASPEGYTLLLLARSTSLDEGAFAFEGCDWSLDVLCDKEGLLCEEVESSKGPVTCLPRQDCTTRTVFAGSYIPNRNLRLFRDILTHPLNLPMSLRLRCVNDSGKEIAFQMLITDTSSGCILHEVSARESAEVLNIMGLAQKGQPANDASAAAPRPSEPAKGGKKPPSGKDKEKEEVGRITIDAVLDPRAMEIPEAFLSKEPYRFAADGSEEQGFCAPALQWRLEVISSAGVTMSHDTATMNAHQTLISSWEEADPGRAERATTLREQSDPKERAAALQIDAEVEERRQILRAKLPTIQPVAPQHGTAPPIAALLNAADHERSRAQCTEDEKIGQETVSRFQEMYEGWLTEGERMLVKQTSQYSRYRAAFESQIQ